ncbi:MAG: hypothetical protein ABSB29_08450 [Nitrososphaerales archaeon]|jgi:hypothetical protein
MRGISKSYLALVVVALIAVSAAVVVELGPSNLSQKNSRTNTGTSTSGVSTASSIGTSTSSMSTVSSVRSGYATGFPLLEFQTLVTSTDSQYGYFLWKNVFSSGSELKLGAPSNASLSTGMDVYVTVSDSTISHSIYSTAGKIVAGFHAGESYNFSILVQNASMPLRIPVVWGASAGDKVVLSVYNCVCAPSVVINGVDFVGKGSSYEHLNIVQCVHGIPCVLPPGVTFELIGQISVFDALPINYILPLYTSKNTTIESVLAYGCPVQTQGCTVSLPTSEIEPSPPISDPLWVWTNAGCCNISPLINVNITLTAPKQDFLGGLFLNITGTYPLSLLPRTAETAQFGQIEVDTDVKHSAEQSSQLTVACPNVSPSNALGYVEVLEPDAVKWGSPWAGPNLTSMSFTYGGETYTSALTGSCGAPTRGGVFVDVMALPGITSYGESYTGVIAFGDGETISFNGLFE